MNTELDARDIQGNILKAYGHFGFPKARYVFFGVTDGEAGRAFVRALIPRITRTDDSDSNPSATTNLAMTYQGLKRLGVPEASLRTFPEEFVMGMKARRDVLGDDERSSPEHWDPIWQRPEPVHILLSINGQQADIERRYSEIMQLAGSLSPGIELLIGHCGDGDQADLPYQEASALYENDRPTAKEHFGFTDGISNPYFKGSGTHPANLLGGGKLTGKDPSTSAGWEPLETGEFLLGYKDESLQLPEAPKPKLLSHNGTFMVYRKLHQNVASFDRYLEEAGKLFPGGEEAVAAKFAGRWRNGAPLASFPTEAEANQMAADWVAAKQAIENASGTAERALAKRRFAELNAKFVAFDYREDIVGGKCPLGAHIRRVHPRGALQFGHIGAFATSGALSNRRRLLRRGLPYGQVDRPARDDGNHGIIFMAMSASISRQFEFVQQQWINYGNDFRLANDKDPIVGNHGTARSNEGDARGRMTFQAEPEAADPPFFCAKIPRFVETRGGDYFFIPSMTALRSIGQGSVDPT